MPGSPKFNYLLSTLAALGLSSCAVKDGRLDFTWWQDAAAPIVEDDVIIESGGSGYYRSSPAPERVPAASIPREEAPAPQPEQPRQVVAQQQPATQQPAAAPRPATRRPAPAQTIPGEHLVQPGDTLTALARRYGTTVNALVAANGMAHANVPLRVNQRLKIPTASQAPAARPAATRPAAPAAAPVIPAASPNGIYTVQAGDTLYKISRQYGVRPAALMQANGLTPETANTIRVGQTLRIPTAP